MATHYLTNAIIYILYCRPVLNGANKRIGELETPNITRNEQRPTPLLDQHIAVIKDYSSLWVIPVGVLAVGLRFYEPIQEYAELVHGLLSNIIGSLVGRFTNTQDIKVY